MQMFINHIVSPNSLNFPIMGWIFKWSVICLPVSIQLTIYIIEQMKYHHGFNCYISLSPLPNVDEGFIFRS